MKKSIIYLMVWATMAFGSLFGQNLKTLKIKNDETRDNICVSFGYNKGHLKTFFVIIPPQVTLKVERWDISFSSTQIFVRDAQQPPEVDGRTCKGHIYYITSGKEVDVKYSVRDGLHSNSTMPTNEMLTDADISIRNCSADESNPSLKHISIAENPCSDNITFDAKARIFNHVLSGKKGGGAVFVEGTREQQDSEVGERLQTYVSQVLLKEESAAKK